MINLLCYHHQIKLEFNFSSYEFFKTTFCFLFDVNIEMTNGNEENSYNGKRRTDPDEHNNKDKENKMS